MGPGGLKAPPGKTEVFCTSTVSSDGSIRKLKVSIYEESLSVQILTF